MKEIDKINLIIKIRKIYVMIIAVIAAFAFIQIFPLLENYKPIGRIELSLGFIDRLIPYLVVFSNLIVILFCIADLLTKHRFTGWIFLFAIIGADVWPLKISTKILLALVIGNVFMGMITRPLLKSYNKTITDKKTKNNSNSSLS